MSSAHDMSTLPCASTSAVDSTTRVDFISELPFEIVMDNIIPRIMRKEDDIINLRDRECYFAVCTMWSKRIAASDDNIHFHIYSNNAFLHADWMRVEAVAEHLKTLTVAASNHKAMSNLIQHGHFASLTDLTMIGTQGWWW